ncbi:ATP-grasp domain-containing protein, partial [Pseudomonas aeruginosa]|uniref:ATP-grasp domain-containing protein n=1 Tax=Pseudomonas aeruginosa TaxID=287 RepID=UPI003BF5A200
MNLHEYQAKQLFARYGMPAPTGYACTTPREAEEAASKIGSGPWVVGMTSGFNQFGRL